MNENFSDELISAYLDGELTADEQAAVERELIDNAESRRMFDELRTIRANLQALPRYSLDDRFAQRVLRRAERVLLSSDEATAAPPQSAASIDSATAAAALVSITRENDSARELARWKKMFWAAASLAAGLLVTLTVINRVGERDVALNEKSVAQFSDATLPQTASLEDRAEDLERAASARFSNLEAETVESHRGGAVPSASAPAAPTGNAIGGGALDPMNRTLRKADESENGKAAAESLAEKAELNRSVFMFRSQDASRGAEQPKPATSAPTRELGRDKNQFNELRKSSEMRPELLGDALDIAEGQMTIRLRLPASAASDPKVQSLLAQRVRPMNEESKSRDEQRSAKADEVADKKADAEADRAKDVSSGTARRARLLTTFDTESVNYVLLEMTPQQMAATLDDLSRLAQAQPRAERDSTPAAGLAADDKQPTSAMSVPGRAAPFALKKTAPAKPQSPAAPSAAESALGGGAGAKNEPAKPTDSPPPPPAPDAINKGLETKADKLKRIAGSKDGAAKEVQPAEPTAQPNSNPEPLAAAETAPARLRVLLVLEFEPAEPVKVRAAPATKE